MRFPWRRPIRAKRARTLWRANDVIRVFMNDFNNNETLIVSPQIDRSRLPRDPRRHFGGVPCQPMAGLRVGVHSVSHDDPDVPSRSH